MKINRSLGLALVSWLLLSMELASSQFVVLSGGSSPSGNHYSQYLQTKSLTDNLRERFGSPLVEVAFGAGNRFDGPPLIADVHRTFTTGPESNLIAKMLAGNINRNQEASKENTRRMLLRQARPHRPLFFLVSDHGMPNQQLKGTHRPYSNNCINLWEINVSMRSWISDEEGCLSVQELEGWLKKLPSSKIIYGMSQCYSGGFHQMTVKTNTRTGHVSVNPKICGFTATTEDLTASGCTPNVDGPNYAGYERFFTKQIIGKDFITNRPTNIKRKLNNLYQAHILASLEDFTTDIPLASSDYYLSEVAKSFWNFGVQSDFSSSKLSESKILALIKKYSHPQYIQMDNEVYKNYVSLLRLTITLLKKNTPEVQRWGSIDLVQLKNYVNALKNARSDIIEEDNELYAEIQSQRDIAKEEWISTVDHAQAQSALGLTKDQEALEKQLVEEYGLSSFRSKKVINFSLSYLAAENPEQEIILATYLAAREKKFEKYFQSRLSAHLLEMNKKIGFLDQRYERLDSQYRYARKILMLREQLGILGAAMEIDNQKILQNFIQLRKCETTNFPQN